MEAPAEKRHHPQSVNLELLGTMHSIQYMHTSLIAKKKVDKKAECR